MSTITQVRIWNDCGFTNNAIEVPSVDNELPNPDMVIREPLNVNTAELFSRISLTQSYARLMNASYIEVTIDWNNGSAGNQIFYGWVDEVGMKSDTEGYPMTEIYWHVDLWRTYLAQAQFGYGMVNRRPMVENDSIPPQPYPYRYHEVGSFRYTLGQLFDEYWWVYISTDQQVKPPTDEPTVKAAGQTFVYQVFPINVKSISEHVMIKAVGESGEGSPCPSAYDVFSGQWDEKLKLVPESIKGVFMSPYAPSSLDKEGGAIILTNWYHGPGNGFFSMNTPRAFTDTEYHIAGGLTLTSDDTKKYVVLGFDGEVVGELPWGVPVETVHMRTIISSTAGYIQVRTDVNGHANGTCWTIPLIPVDLTQNSWSSYVYSGARQSDIDQRKLNADMSFHFAKQDIAANALSETMMGMLAGGSAGGLFAPAGAGVGVATAVASTALKYATAKQTYDYNIGEANDRQQAINDYKAAMQPNGLIMAGSGFDVLVNGIWGITILELKTDDYSQQVRADDIAKFGVHVSEPTEDCSQLVRTGGGLQITNLIVKGDIPVEAKRYIKQRLASGVRII